jgi:hypothetical protein
MLRYVLVTEMPELAPDTRQAEAPPAVVRACTTTDCIAEVAFPHRTGDETAARRPVHAVLHAESADEPQSSATQAKAVGSGHGFETMRSVSAGRKRA